MEALVLPDPALASGRGLSQKLGEQILRAPHLPAQTGETLGHPHQSAIERVVVRGAPAVEERQAHQVHRLVGPVPAAGTDAQMAVDLGGFDVGHLTQEEPGESLRIGVLLPHGWQISRHWPHSTPARPG